MHCAIMILAHDKRAAFHSRRPRFLHPLLGRPLLAHVLELAEALAERPPLLAITPATEVPLREWARDRARFVTVTPTRIPANARQAIQRHVGDAAQLLILRGDAPLLQRETLEQLLAQQTATGAAFATLENAPEAGVLSGRPDTLWNYLPSGDLDDLASLVTRAASDGERVATVLPGEPLEATRVTTRLALSTATRALCRRINRRWMEAGVTLVDPATTYIEPGVTIGRDSVIQPNTHLRGATAIGEESVIGPNSIVDGCTIGDRCTVQASVIEGATIEDESDIGPFGRLRKGAHLKQGVHMGSFGEVKNSTLGEGSHMGHFSYLGDAEVGPNVNLSAGIITCNYDGRQKHRTTIGRDVFLGSGTLMVAPVEIGEGAQTGAGSVVTHDVPAGKLAFGVPARIKGETSLSRKKGESEDREGE